MDGLYLVYEGFYWDRDILNLRTTIKLFYKKAENQFIIGMINKSLRVRQT
jgi:hypothetical protein